MVASTVIMALNLAFLGNHIHNYGGHVKSLIALSWEFLNSSLRSRSSCKDAAREAKVNEALWEVRARTYRHSIEFMIHQSAVAVFGMGFSMSLEPSFTQLVQVGFMLSVYLAHHCVCSGRLTLNAANLRTIYILFYSSFVFFVLANVWQKDDSGGRAITNQTFNAGSRMIMSVIFMDTLTALPRQVAISCTEVFQYSMQQDITETVGFAWVQALVCAGITIFSVVLEYWVTSHITSLLETETMLSSFRRMLRGVCDGEVLLGEDLKIKEEAECLKHLMMDSRAFQGKDFQKFLDPEEATRFLDFLQQSERDAHQPEEQRTRTPPCLRISLRGASDIRVGVDLWHVPMRSTGSGTSHLIALREDSEAQQAISSEDQPDLQLPPHQGDPDAMSELSDSQKSSTSLLRSFPELMDMTLCVDTSTHWFDVEQAHLSFARQPQSSDSSMPSLRRLVRGTDWETLRAKLKKVTEGGEETMQMRLRDDAQRTVVANCVHVSAFRPPRATDEGVKLCLNFSDLVFEEKNQKEKGLEGIEE
ncbi:Uncharacterized protein SCF082_LOCUS22278 [Durusdinium trenchii]|uniref:Uncharacterized protein n=1 Tax=Durusdinium trenchii TaxID=1381693 RepID=A0ABP0LHC0_9DINO